MANFITKNFHAILYAYLNPKYNGIVLEGGSRSRKTWSFIEFLIWYCQDRDGKVIKILKETFNSFKTTLHSDFKKQFQELEFRTKFDYAEEVKQFELLNNRIHFIGADKISKTLGSGSDIFIMNEGLEINNEYFDQFEQRCDEFFIMDYNPYYTQHYVYDKIITRPDVYFCQTTLFDNPYIPDNQKRKILSYEPWHPDDRHLPEAERREHPTNIKNGTADEYMCNVYLYGKRGSRKGLIHLNIKYINEFPDIVYIYGMDFGFTNDPSTIIKVGIDEKNIYLELLLYEPTKTPEILDTKLTERGIEKNIPIEADSSDKYSNEHGTIEMVRDLRLKGWEISKVSKTKTVKYWLEKFNEYTIHIINNNYVKFAKIEAENYKWMEINGIYVNKPIDKFDHFWNGSRYGFMAFFSNYSFNYQQ